jgi:hypothetical protein
MFRRRPEVTDFSRWYAGKDFTRDWTSRRFKWWPQVLTPYKNKTIEILEIGSWEGRSAIFFLNFFPKCRLTAIDTFMGSPELTGDPVLRGQEAELRFDSNLVEYSSRLRKLKSSSFKGLAQLATEFRRFDLVYVDGSHHSFDVYGDGAMAWPLLNQGGILIFDDYDWELMPEMEERPKLGIDAFLASHQGQYKEIYRGPQIILRKR